MANEMDVFSEDTKENANEFEEVMSLGYGIIPQYVMRDKSLSIEAKAIYSYICSFAGLGNQAYPSVSLMLEELKISENRYYKYKRELVEKGYLEVHLVRKKQEEKEKNKKCNNYNIYTLVGHVIFKDGENMSKKVKTVAKTKAAEEVKEVKTKKNSKKAEEDNKKVQEVVDMYHEICISMSKVRAINPKRKRAVLTSLKKYGLEELRKIFEYAQKNSFLSGQDTGWSADFEWLINENNIVKVLEGKYEKPFKNKNNNQNQNNQGYQNYQGYQNNQREITPSNTPNTTNRFNRFGQRNYTKEELEEIELRLLNRQ